MWIWLVKCGLLLFILIMAYIHLYGIWDSINFSLVSQRTNFCGVVKRAMYPHLQSPFKGSDLF